MRAIETAGVMHGGKIRLDDKRNVEAALAKYPDGLSVALTIEPLRAGRSLGQNKRYFAILRIAAQDTGHTVPELHELMKWACNPLLVEVVNKATGEVEEATVGGTTTALDKEQFSEYTERVLHYLAEHLGIVVPDPEAI
jgi:hypothetical protein